MRIPVILKGDTSTKINITIASGADYNGSSLRVLFNGIERRLTNIQAGETRQIQFTAQESSRFPLGTAHALLSIITPSGGVVSLPWCSIKVTDSPNECYEGGIIIDPTAQLDVTRPQDFIRKEDLTSHVNNASMHVSANDRIEWDKVQEKASEEDVRSIVADSLTAFKPLTDHQIELIDSITQKADSSDVCPRVEYDAFVHDTNINLADKADTSYVDQKIGEAVNDCVTKVQPFDAPSQLFALSFVGGLSEYSVEEISTAQNNKINELIEAVNILRSLLIK